MKTIILSFVYLYFIFLTTTPCKAQDLIVLQSGEEIDAKILTKKGPSIKYVLWEDQEGEVQEIDKKFVKRHRMEYLTKERVSFSFSFGGVPYGTSTSLKNYMKENRYEGTSSSLFGSSEYPTSSVKVSWMMEFEYLIKPPHGFSIEFAQTNKGSVTGINSAGYGANFLAIFFPSGLTPQIFYSNPQLSASYKYYLKSYKSNLQVGLILNNARVRESGENNNSGRYSKLSWGLLIGYAGSLVEKEVFFLRFQTQFRYIYPLEVTNSDSFMNGEKIGLSHLFIGIQTGVKIAKHKK